MDRVRASIRTPRAAYDLLVVCDCGSLDRLGGVRQRHARSCFERLPRVLVDHHASNTDGGPVDWVDPTAAATCELVALLAARLGVPLDAADGALAAALMAGIVMDTSTFAHPNATPRTLAVSAALVAAGAPLSDISRRLYRSKPDAPAPALRPGARSAGGEPMAGWIIYSCARATPTSPRPARRRRIPRA